MESRIGVELELVLLGGLEPPTQGLGIHFPTLFRQGENKRFPLKIALFI